MTLYWSYFSGAGALVVMWLLAGLVANAWDPFRLAEGADRRLSVSKLQWLLWTAVVVFGYVATLVARGLNGGFGTALTLPSNLLIAMGFSATTMVTAKGITTAYVAQGRVVKPQTPPAGASYYSDLVQDDTNQTDLSKVQLLIWTAIALGMFVVNVILNINAINASHTPGDTSLPDIDNALMVLMGLAQGGYLGKKLVTTSRLQINAITPDAVSRAAGSRVALIGSGFGAAMPGNVARPEDTTSALLIDGYPATANVTAWSDSRIVFALGATHPSGAAWQNAAQDVEVTVAVGGIKPALPTGEPQTVELTVSP